MTTTECKHNWNFISADTDTLKCQRCGTVTGPKPYDQRVKDMLQDVTTIGSAWSKGGERIDPLSVYKNTDDLLEEARQAELNACCTLLEGMHVATDGNHNYYLHAANELRKLRERARHEMQLPPRQPFPLGPRATAKHLRQRPVLQAEESPGLRAFDQRRKPDCLQAV